MLKFWLHDVWHCYLVDKKLAGTNLFAIAGPSLIRKSKTMKRRFICGVQPDRSSPIPRLLSGWLLVLLAIFPASNGFALDCQPYWTAEYKCMNGCGCAGGGGGAAIPSGPDPMQMGAAALGGAIGTGIANWMNGSSQPDPAQVAAQQAAAAAQAEAERQRQLREQAAQQLKNSGIYLFKQRNYTLALHEFEQALDQTPGDPEIIKDIAATKQKIKDTAVAVKNSGALKQLLGDTPADSGKFDFDQLTHSSLPSPNSSPLNLVNLDSDPNVVDLRGTTKSYVDPAMVRGDSAGKPADAQQALKDLNNLLDNDTDKVKKQLEDFANSYLPNAPEVPTPTSSPQSQPAIQNQKPTVEQTTKELDEALGQDKPATAQQPSVTEVATAVAENTQGGGTEGVKGLPGIYLNDDTGKGNNKPYGIPGLPGTYVNGPGEGSGLTKPETSPGTTAESPATSTSPQPTTTETVSAPQPVAQPTEPATQHRTIDLGNAGNPDFDGKMGGQQTHHRKRWFNSHAI